MSDRLLLRGSPELKLPFSSTYMYSRPARFGVEKKVHLQMHLSAYGVAAWRMHTIKPPILSFLRNIVHRRTDRPDRVEMTEQEQEQKTQELTPSNDATISTITADVNALLLKDQ